ncbi:MAG: hypothetical protein DDT22_00241 [candidate division WS2 bacterium]|nr:hypothetical protein [Candidatus Lithacetigena glycinireducens]
MNNIILFLFINSLIFVVAIGFMLLLKYFKNIKVTYRAFFIVAAIPIFNIILLFILIYELIIINTGNKWLK